MPTRITSDTFLEREFCGCAILTRMLKALLWSLLVISFGCAQPNVIPGMTFLVGLDGYQNEMQRLEGRPERWFDRQRVAESLKTTYVVTVGGSREFNRMVDLDLRRREFLITMRHSSVKPERVQEMKNELVTINKDVDVLKEIVKNQVAAAELQRQKEPQLIETAAAIGLLHLAIDSFSSMGVTPGPNPRTVKVGSYNVSDLGASFSTVRTPEGQTFRCTTVLIPEQGATIKCEPPAAK
jgi:hypothetical protein